MATRQRPGQTGEASYGSRTLTIHDVPAEEQQSDVPAEQGDDGNAGPSQGVLRLRGGGNTRRVVWSEETVDNEGMGKKKSKICCIYHKPKAFDESSGESSSSDSSSDSDSDSDASTSAHSDDVNASKALREKRAAAAANGKAKERSRHEQADGVDDNADSHDHCDHQHKHGKAKAKKAAIKMSGKSRGSRTVTITEPARDESNPQHPDEHNRDPVSGDPRHPLPNAYERGPS